MRTKKFSIGSRLWELYMIIASGGFSLNLLKGVISMMTEESTSPIKDSFIAVGFILAAGMFVSSCVRLGCMALFNVIIEED